MKLRWIFVVAIGVAVSTFTACGGGPSPVAGTSETEVDPHWLYGGEDIWIPVVDTLGSELSSASRTLEDHQPADAAKALRAGAVFLESETEKLTPEGRAKVKAAAVNLKNLADTIDSGAKVTIEELQTQIREAFSVDMDYRWGTTDISEWVPVVLEVQTHFEEARGQLEAQRPQEAATELRKAAALLRLEAGRIGGDAKKAIEGSWFEVRQLAAKTQTGGVTDIAKMERVAASSCQTLAQAHQAEAEGLWTEHQAAQSGQVLDLAVKEFERGLVWIGAQNDPTAKGEAEAARRLADALGTTPAPEATEVAGVFEGFDTAIAALGVQLAPPKPTS
jgi:hypothetical protein